MKMALIVIDVQEAYVGNKRGKDSFENIMGHINYAMELFRKAGSPIIVVRDIAEGDGEAYRNIEELETVDSDLSITKVYNNAFWKTNLEKILQDLDVDFLVLCGNAAEYCVGATYNGAEERGFKTTLLQNGIFAAREENLLMHFYNRPLISYVVLEALLE
ncbi:MAG: isochorismatase family protein [Clostridia bacterium]|nr:isochorismatase family protein [Clostridia bacterium]